MSYPNHEEIIFESEDLDLVEYEYRDAIDDTDYNRKNDIEYYEIWSDNGSIMTTFVWYLHWGIAIPLCRFHTYDFTLTLFIMFLQVSDIKSSMVADLRIDAGKNQAIVEYKDGSKYLYNDVDFSALYDLIYRQTDSIGQWVINSCKVKNVQCVKLWALQLASHSGAYFFP